MRNQRGAVLLMVLVSVTLMGLMAGIAGSSWQTYMQKSQEADLLWKGSQIREAIGRYYEYIGTGVKKIETKGTKSLTKPTNNAFPKSLEDLLEDPRALESTRYLRRLYPDPMTREEWILIRSPKGGGIMGVRSTSNLQPFKQYGFSEENKNFAGQKEYSAWQFIFTPKKTSQSSKKSESKADSSVTD